MSRKLKTIISVLVAVVLLTVGGAVTVMAQEEEPVLTPEPGTKMFMVTDNTTGLLARVAGILGIPQEDLANAFKQAQQEMREEAFSRYLDKAVEEGRITEEEANAIIEWNKQRPEVLGAGLFPRTLGASGLRSRHMGGGHKFMVPRSRHMWGGHRGWCSDDTT